MKDNFVNVKGAKIHFIEEGEGKPFLLFHGARFNAYTWVETGTVSSIASARFKAISIDFPGFGKSQNGDFDSLSSFIKDFMDTMNIEKAYLLGASMGGEAILGFAVDNPNMVEGLVLVGAVGVPSYESKLKNLDGKPILLIWGEKDSISPRRNAEIILNHIKSAKLIIVGKQHACYLDDAKKFNEEIVKFLKGE
ncbi:alpha/beta hydrolase [Sulfolobus sp. S-194]|uniref:alpha/beta fold hydrolase n=1 Tax=Sulfolobus sp. S-194 TaxID=2512240 RepID=UPI001436E78F|nr:alpha/beta hydrolase [Sulfolobus sp. S-194]QIW24894.1 alpha/beta hydrolase [Sulfolobus sp. S-194]